jgi:hemin uptake protein HemP
MSIRQKGSIGKKIFLDVTFPSHDNDSQFDINYHLMVCFISTMMMDTANTPTPAAAAPTEHSANAPPSYDSAQLLGADGIAFITHQGQRYQLRQTKAGKLILTK